MRAEDGAATPDVSKVEQGLAAVHARIARACPAGLDPRAIAIMAVTKGFGAAAPRAAIAAGVGDLGENYYQEAAPKYAQVTRPAGVRLHFIGRVQRNKARRIAELFDAVQTLDDLSIAQALDDAAAVCSKKLTVLVQVNVVHDQRQGVMPQDAGAFVERLNAMHHLAVAGLMAMGPREPREAPSAFARARACFEELRVQHPHIDTLSMGMSDDLEIAVAAGSTMVRVGTALFGARPPRA